MAVSGDGSEGRDAEVMFSVLLQAEDSSSGSEAEEEGEEEEPHSMEVDSESEAAEESDDYSDLEYAPTEEEQENIRSTVLLEEPYPEGVNAAYTCTLCRCLLRACVQCSDCSATFCYLCHLGHKDYCEKKDITPFCAACKKASASYSYNQVHQGVVDEFKVQCTLCSNTIAFGNFYEHVHLSCEKADSEQRLRAAIAQKDLDKALTKLTGRKHGVGRSVSTRRRSTRRRSTRGSRGNSSNDSSLGQPQQQRQPRVATDELYMRVFTARLSGDFPQAEKMNSLYSKWNKYLLQKSNLPTKPKGFSDEYVLQWQGGVHARQRRLPHESEAMAEAANEADDDGADPDYAPTEQE